MNTFCINRTEESEIRSGCGIYSSGQRQKCGSYITVSQYCGSSTIVSIVFSEFFSSIGTSYFCFVSLLFIEKTINAVNVAIKVSTNRQRPMRRHLRFLYHGFLPALTSTRFELFFESLSDKKELFFPSYVSVKPEPFFKSSFSDYYFFGNP